MQYYSVMFSLLFQPQTILVSYTGSFSNILLNCIVVGFIICLVFVMFVRSIQRGETGLLYWFYDPKYRGKYFMALIVVAN